MAVEVILPKVDMDMATGRISKWLVAEGAMVKKGDALFEIETDKAAMEVEAPGSGKLGQITGREGDEVPIGHVVAWIFGEGETAAAAPADKVAAPIEQAPTKPTPAESRPAQQAATASNDVRATPLARRLARDKGLDLSTIIGSGPHGRITSTDIEALATKPVLKVPVVEKTQPKSQVDDASVLNLFAPGSFTLMPHDAMRKVIARRLTESKSSVPHFYISADCRIDALLKLRQDLNASAPKTDAGSLYKLSINDFVIKAWSLALRDVPGANVSWTEAAMLRHTNADIGVAVSIDGGLITPIIRKAETKSLSAISNEMKDLAARARTRKLKSDEYNGGTSAISNLGMFGVKEFSAIINPPHATILAVGSGDQRAIVENGVVVPAAMMTVTLSTDHRAVDGALGAEVLSAFRSYIEKPMAMLV